jgi:hypothetical protein
MRLRLTAVVIGGQVTYLDFIPNGGLFLRLGTAGQAKTQPAQNRNLKSTNHKNRLTIV